MQFQNIPWTVVVFIIAQLGTFIWFLIKLHFKSEKTVEGLRALELKVAGEMSEIKRENIELKKELKDMRDILVKVENNTHLLMLGRIKTGSKEAA